jgi:hypothetical protein
MTLEEAAKLEDIERRAEVLAWLNKWTPMPLVFDGSLERYRDGSGYYFEVGFSDANGKAIFGSEIRFEVTGGKVALNTGSMGGVTSKDVEMVEKYRLMVAVLDHSDEFMKMIGGLTWKAQDALDNWNAQKAEEKRLAEVAAKQKAYDDELARSAVVGYKEKYTCPRPYFVDYDGNFTVIKVTDNRVTILVNGSVVRRIRVRDYVNDMIQYRLDLKRLSNL